MVYNGTFWVQQTGSLGAIALLNIGAFLKNNGSGNLAVNNGLGLATDGTGALTVAAAAVVPSMLSAAAGAQQSYAAALGAQGAGNLTLLMMAATQTMRLTSQRGAAATTATPPTCSRPPRSLSG